MKKNFILAILILAAGFGTFLLVRTHILKHVEAVFSQDENKDKAKDEEKTQPPFDTAALSTKLDEIVAKYPSLDTGVVVTDLVNGQKLVYGETAVFEAASTTKLITATTMLHQIEEGKYTLDTTLSGQKISELLKSLIEISDNDAWAVLDNKLTWAAERVYAGSIGVSSYANSKTNGLTASDSALLLEKLYTGKLLNKSNTDLLLGHMAKANNKYIGTALGSSYTVYHKTGYLEDRLMDNAIITGGPHPYVLVIFTKTSGGAYNFETGKTLFNSITAAVNYALANI